MVVYWKNEARHVADRHSAKIPQTILQNYVNISIVQIEKLLKAHFPKLGMPIHLCVIYHSPPNNLNNQKLSGSCQDTGTCVSKESVLTDL